MPESFVVGTHNSGEGWHVQFRDLFMRLVAKGLIPKNYRVRTASFDWGGSNPGEGPCLQLTVMLTAEQAAVVGEAIAEISAESLVRVAKE